MVFVCFRAGPPDYGIIGGARAHASARNWSVKEHMKAKIIDGKAIAAELRAEVAAGVRELESATGVKPGLAVVLAGCDPASVSYVTAKEKACAEAGMRSFDIRLPADAGQDALLERVRSLNADPGVHGILVQLPLPPGYDAQAVIEAISPEKDVDGFTPENMGRLAIGRDCFIPCTPHGVMELLARAGVETAGRHAVVIGRSNIVGKPLALLLSRKDANATVTVCHTGTPDLAEHVRRADIVIAAAGRPGTVTGDMVKPGAAVVDVGVNRVPDATRERGWRLAGDCDFAACAEKASFITPVPGGVGPMTIAMLLCNTLQAARRFAAAGARGA